MHLARCTWKHLEKKKIEENFVQFLYIILARAMFVIFVTIRRHSFSSLPVVAVYYFFFFTFCLYVRISLMSAWEFLNLKFLQILQSQPKSSLKVHSFIFVVSVECSFFFFFVLFILFCYFVVVVAIPFIFFIA